MSKTQRPACEGLGQDQPARLRLAPCRRGSEGDLPCAGVNLQCVERRRCRAVDRPVSRDVTRVGQRWAGLSAIPHVLQARPHGLQVARPGASDECVTAHTCRCRTSPLGRTRSWKLGPGWSRNGEWRRLETLPRSHQHRARTRWLQPVHGAPRCEQQRLAEARLAALASTCVVSESQLEEVSAASSPCSRPWRSEAAHI